MEKRKAAPGNLEQQQKKAKKNSKKGESIKQVPTPVNGNTNGAVNGNANGVKKNKKSKNKKSKNKNSNGLQKQTPSTGIVSKENEAKKQEIKDKAQVNEDKAQEINDDKENTEEKQESVEEKEANVQEEVAELKEKFKEKEKKEKEKDIEKETEETEKPDPSVTFESLGLRKELCEAVSTLGWKSPSQIQREAIPFAIEGRDVIGLAETGSGKTGAFALPILQSLLDKPQGLAALVLSPTRELAFQISEQFEALGSGIHLRCAVVVGGIDLMDQAIALSKKPHVVVASPGRLVDHLESTKGFNLKNLRFLVLDEADRLLNMDFEKEINKILEIIPRERQTFLFSATMTSKVEKLQRASLTNPVKVKVSNKYQTVKGLIQQYVFVPAKHKDVYLTYILNELTGNTMMIFTSTCEHTQRVAFMLRNLGFSAIPLHGKMTQPKRLGALNKFKSGQRGILIATDVASRGLDIPSVDVVINFDIPTHSKDYIHRVGRTARAGRSGRAITVVTQYDVELFQRIELLIGKKMDQFPLEEDNVMLLLERVSEAQREATMQMREMEGMKKEKDNKGGKKKKMMFPKEKKKKKKQ